MGFVRNEKTFLTLMFMKTRLQDWLCEHFDLVVHMFVQPFNTVDIFLYDHAMTVMA
jgi:hypothetical protein